MLFPPPKFLEGLLDLLGAVKLRVGVDCLMPLLLKLLLGADWRLLFPNERDAPLLGEKVRLGTVVVLLRPKVRCPLLGCVTVVRVLLWREEPPKVRWGAPL